MTERRILGMAWAVALIVLLVGTVLTVRTALDLRERGIRIQRKQQEWAAATALRAELADYEAAAAAMMTLPEDKPARLDGLMEATLGGIRPDDSRDVVEAVAEGWRARRRELVFADAPLKDVMDFVQRAEASAGGAAGDAPSRPPWRLEKLAFQASARASGRGRIVATLLTVEREPGP